jgi:hypothetical protein
MSFYWTTVSVIISLVVYQRTKALKGEKEEAIAILKLTSSFSHNNKKVVPPDSFSSK